MQKSAFLKFIPLKDKFDLNFKRKFSFYLTPITKHQACSTFRNLVFKKKVFVYFE